MNKAAFSLLFTLVFVFCGQVAEAQVPVDTNTTVNSSSVNGLTDPQSGWQFSLVPYDCRDANGCDICEITKVFTNGANLVGAFMSAIALFMFVLGGMLWIFSGGQEERVQSGKKIIVGTVVGLVIIFTAWIAVNIIVRTAALTGGTSSTQIFSKDWWSFEHCYPDLLPTCQGRSIGDVCGGEGVCGSGDPAEINNPACYCWRPINSEGDNNRCLGDDTNALINEADHDVTNLTTDEAKKNKSCACVDTCAILRIRTNKDYQCINASLIDNSPGKYQVDELARCADSTDATPKKMCR